MAKRMELIEVGDFVKYKDHLMAVVAIHEDKNRAYALCRGSERIVKFDLDDADISMVKKKGCKAIVRAIFSDMEMIY